MSVMTAAHDQGRGEWHLSLEELETVTAEATRDSAGLAPAGSLYEGAWTEKPRGSDSPGRAGMRAYDDDYFYYCFGDGDWRRAPLSDF